MKRTKGITLIALVITVIVMLILAGVAINLTVGENGIFKKTKIAKNMTEEAQIKEEILLVLQDIILDNLGLPPKDKLIEQLTEKLENVIIIENTEEKIVIEYKGYEWEIDSVGNVKGNGKVGMKVSYTLEPEGYTTQDVNILLTITLQEDNKLLSVTPQDSTIETVEENVKYKVKANGTYGFTVTSEQNEKEISIVVNKIDTEAPNARIEIGKKEINRNEAIKATVTVEDEKSGVDLEKCKWVVNQSGEAVGLDITAYTGGSLTSENGEVETQKMTTPGTYYLHLLVTDVLGNAKEVVSEAVTVRNSYAISTPEDLQNIKNDITASYYVVNDIDMSGFNFTTIPGEFSGTLDGQGCTISNLTISGEGNVAIFNGAKDNAKIQNLLLKNVSISATGYNCGVLVAHIYPTFSGGHIQFNKVGITGTVTGYSSFAAFVGGELVTYGAGTTTVSFEDCYARVDLLGVEGASMYDAVSFINCREGNTATALNCYWAGTNSKKYRTGGLISASGAFNNDNQLTHSGISVQNSYYDKTKFSVNVTQASGIGLTTAQMKDQSSYAGWDFENTWIMGEDGYPELRFTH